jgi:3-dehydroquinate dehydratase-1
MTKPRDAKIVGVIYSRADFQRAIQMRNPPDLFELRLDALARNIATVGKNIDQLPAPLIITARDPREGGAHKLSVSERREMLLAFLPHAAWVDVELRSARALRPVLLEARAKNLGVIISFHDLQGTPSIARLDEIARRALSLGPDVVKIATQTDTPRQLERLLEFFDGRPREAEIAAMGIGQLGRDSRLELARRGCPLNYAHLGTPHVAGQLSIPELRRALR